MNKELFALPLGRHGKGSPVNSNLVFGMVDGGNFALSRFDCVRIARRQVNGLSIALQLPHAGHLDLIPGPVVKFLRLKIVGQPFHTHLPVKSPISIECLFIRRFAACQRRIKIIVRQSDDVRFLLVFLNDRRVLPIIQFVCHIQVPLSQWFSSNAITAAPGPRLRPHPGEFQTRKKPVFPERFRKVWYALL